MARISYAKYNLTPLKRLNRFENKKRSGLIIRYEGKKVGYSDYFPWVELGDLALDDFIFEFSKNSENLFFLSLVDQAKEFSTIDFSKLYNLNFKNHQLITGDENIIESTLKVKIGNNLHEDILKIKDLIDRKTLLRLDANSGYSVEEIMFLWNSLTCTEKKYIEYIEDPTNYNENDWRYLNKIKIPIALDRVSDWSCVSNDCFDFLIYKPNISRFELVNNINKPIIFSSYMGHDLGRIYCLYKLLKHGNLELFHGINTPNLYLEQKELFTRNKSGLSLTKNIIHDVIGNIEGLEWKSIL